jgi:hypothetical protein
MMTNMADQTEQVPLGLDTLEDDDGNKLLSEAAAGLQQIEDHLQQYLDSHDGKHHEKPYKLTVEVEVTAGGKFRRGVAWGVTVKMPNVAQKHVQSARSQAGMLITDASAAGQMKLPATTRAELENASADGDE